MKNWAMTAILTVPLVAQTPGSGTLYAPQSTVSLTEFGVSFQVPRGWTAAAQDQPGALRLASADGNLIGFLFKARVSDSEMKAFFADKTGGILRLEQMPVAGYSQGWVFDFRDAGTGVQGTGRAVLSPSVYRCAGNRDGQGDPACAAGSARGSLDPSAPVRWRNEACGCGAVAGKGAAAETSPIQRPNRALPKPV